MSMTKEAVRDKMRDNNVVVLDVLPDTDFAKMHITGSESLPLGFNSDDFARSVEKRYGKNKFFITYCAGLTCSVGSTAAKALTERGFKAEDYPGGMQEWSEADFPTEGSAARISKAAVVLPGVVSAN